ncbi:MAG: hypothetical protein QG663_1679, partial [Thermodesulfobacteriota bacterium]|nr:hypothetical protein [Thermodesulfobacteriota bacterium]
MTRKTDKGDKGKRLWFKMVLFLVPRLVT